MTISTQRGGARHLRSMLVVAGDGAASGPPRGNMAMACRRRLLTARRRMARRPKNRRFDHESPPGPRQHGGSTVAPGEGQDGDDDDAQKVPWNRHAAFPQGQDGDGWRGRSRACRTARSQLAVPRTTLSAAHSRKSSDPRGERVGGCSKPPTCCSGAPMRPVADISEGVPARWRAARAGPRTGSTAEGSGGRSLGRVIARTGAGGRIGARRRLLRTVPPTHPTISDFF